LGSDVGHVRVHKYQSGNWDQIGADIDGEAVNDFSGEVSLNVDGSIVAIGASSNDGNGTNSGHVRVFQNLAGVWTQIGGDIDGEAIGDRFGTSVSLSSNGSIIAIGAIHNDGNGSEASHVRIFQNNGGNWTQIGEDIDGEATNDHSSYSISLNMEGSIVAIGARANSGNGIETGHTRIFQNIGGIWTQLGEDIEGVGEIDFFGHSVSLSSDGLTVASGAPGNDGSAYDAGHVRVYELLFLPIITIQPVDQIDVCSGIEVNFSIEGERVDIYKWQVSIDSGNTWSDLSNNEVYSGTANDTLTILSNMELNNFEYRCCLTNGDGNTISNSATLNIESEVPTIICVSDQEVDAGMTNTYTVLGTEFDAHEAIDNCGIVETQNNFNNSASLEGAQLPYGKTSIIWTITDSAGNEETCSFNVLVN